jgi:Zn-dependent peptidase ImmA (M78 family)
MDKIEKIRARIKSMPLDIEALFSDLSVGYERSFHLDDHIVGELERTHDRGFVIRTNANHSRERQRFTAAHELGHYMMHRTLLGSGVDDDKSYRSCLEYGNFKNKNIQKRHETEANQFAAAILMPSVTVRQEFVECPDLDRLARLFCVSNQAMAIRLKSLDLKVVSLCSM